MELASNLLLSEENKQTMGILPRNQSKVEVPQYFGQVEEVSVRYSRGTLKGTVIQCSMVIWRSIGMGSSLLPVG